MTQYFVTGYSPEGWGIYGRACAATWERYLPKGSQVIAYCHSSMADELPAGWWCRSIEQVPQLRKFIDRHGENPIACGRVRVGVNNRWKPAEIAAGYNFRYDAVKFAYMSYQMVDAALRLPYCSALAWLDGDVIFRAPAPDDLINRTLRGHEVSYLGRAPKHSEIGWLGFRTTGACRDMLEALTQLYSTDELFHLKEWHSAYAFDHVRAIYERERGLSCRDMTPGGRGHVWMQSELAAFSEHLKGGRKDQA